MAAVAPPSAAVAVVGIIVVASVAPGADVDIFRGDRTAPYSSPRALVTGAQVRPDDDGYRGLPVRVRRPLEGGGGGSDVVVVVDDDGGGGGGKPAPIVPGRGVV